MSQPCTFYLNAELQCGLDAKQTYCNFHGSHGGKSNPITKAEEKNLIQFIEDCNKRNSAIYLTDLHISGLNLSGILKNYPCLIDFSNSILEDCTFHTHTFSGPFLAIDASFLNTGFDIIFFLSGADFSETRFDGVKIPFNHCSFKANQHGLWKGFETIKFVRTIFEGSAMPFPACSITECVVSFEGAVFESHTLSFRIHQFGGDSFIRQSLSISSEEINLSNISFSGHFKYYQDPDYNDFAPKVDLDSIIFSAMASVSFRGANLEKTLFRYTIFENVHFVGCRWLRGNDLDQRKLLYDAVNPPENAKHWPWELIRLYVQLKKNYEEQRNYVGACDWAYREMEQRIIAWSDPENKLSTTNSRRRDVLFYGIYRSLSDYGESYTKPLWWFLGFLLIFSLLNFYFGFKFNGDQEIRYILDPCKWSLINILDFGKSIGASLVGMVPFMGRLVSNSSLSCFPIAVAEVFVGVILIPLFLLALRRNFRR